MKIVQRLEYGICIIIAGLLFVGWGVALAPVVTPIA
jgi:hypothetical protein